MLYSCSTSTQRSAPGLTLDNSACGSRVKPCSQCSRALRDTKACVANGLRIVRIRFRIPYCELPDLEVSELSRYLLFLLGSGKERASVPFPRAQSQRGENGLCSLHRLCRRDRWALAHSLNSFKRNLPAGCKRHTPSDSASYPAKHCLPTPPASSPEYLTFCRREVRRLFPFGWDKSYDGFVDRFVPQSSAREARQSRGDLLWAGREKEFLVGCLHGRCDTSPLTCRYKEVLSAGKVRPLTIFCERVDYLGPLHKCLYGHLSKFDWLLKGPPTPEKIAAVCGDHHRFTSVDLVSATDNLPLDAADAILGALLAKCSKVPGGIRELAMNSLRPLLSGRRFGVDGRLEVTHGQMMGGYLSFPLLCLQSYVAARWAARDTKANFLVNGDDTLIAADRYVTQAQYPDGFVLNLGKTIHAETTVEINSTVFLRSRGKWRQVHHLRRGCALADYRGMLHLAAAVRDRIEWTDAFIRSRIGQRWGFLPSQLGLLGRSFPAFQRQGGMGRSHTDLPTLAPIMRDIGLCRRTGEPEEDEKTALVQLLRAVGRPSGGEGPEPPSHGKLRKTYCYRRPRRWSGAKLTYLSHLSALSVTKAEKVAEYSVPADYLTMKEEKAIRSLSLILWED
jgi:hypothetical protein